MNLSNKLIDDFTARWQPLHDAIDEMRAEQLAADNAELAAPYKGE